MEKQIEEMVKVLGEIQEFGINRPRDEERYPVLYPSNKEVADYLISKGYRKASDVAKETITEAIEVLQEKLLLSVMSNGRYVYEKDDVLFWLRTIPLRMKKKYESEGNK